MAWNYSSITQIDLRENENGIRNKIGSHTKTFISKISDFFYIGKSMDFIHNSSIVFVWPAISNFNSNAIFMFTGVKVGNRTFI